MPESSRLEFLKMFPANNFALPDAEKIPPGQYFCWAHYWQYAKSPERQFFGSDGLVCFISICKYDSFNNPFSTLLACLNFNLDSENLFKICYKQKKWFLRPMAAALAAENHADEWGLTWYLRWGIYTSIPI